MVVDDWFILLREKAEKDLTLFGYRGRCGRTAPGVCYHLAPKRMYEEEFAEYSAPEAVRCSLDEALLYVKLLHAGSIPGFSDAFEFFQSLLRFVHVSACFCVAHARRLTFYWF